MIPPASFEIYTIFTLFQLVFSDIVELRVVFSCFFPYNIWQRDEVFFKPNRKGESGK